MDPVESPVQSAPQPAPVVVSPPGAPAAGQPGNAAQSQTQQSDPNPAYTPEQVQQWQRAANQYKGAEPLIQSLVQAGVKTPDELNAVLQARSHQSELDQMLQSRGMTRDGLFGLLGGTPVQQDAQQSSTSLTREDVARVVSESLANRDIVQGHQRAETQEASAIQQAISGIAGQGSTPEFKALVESLVSFEVERARPLYHQGHPLYESALQPLAPGQIEGIVAKIRPMLDSARGNQALAQAQAAIAQVPNPSGGQFQAQPGAASAPVPFMSQDESVKRAAAQAVMQRAMQAMNPSHMP